ncbi:MAG: sigma-70 family RNA polymerase sigma factor [Lachnospiraceae bacterium]|nr:sigma-70 family RNA polymerase sigma factor [Lachnospiraceae bacterium]
MDKQRMEQVYEENAKAVYKYLFCLTHNADLAEELTQETFYQAMKGIDRFRGECKISVWLCQIAKRLWYRELEKRKTEQVPIAEMTEELRAFDDIENDYLLNVEKVEIFRLLHNLDETTREVMYLRLTGELSFAEIGNIMEKSENWARVTFYRGKQKLMKGRELWNND